MFNFFKKPKLILLNTLRAKEVISQRLRAAKSVNRMYGARYTTEEEKEKRRQEISKFTF